MKFVLWLNMLMPILMVSSHHPVMYMIVILVQTIFLCLLMNLIIKSSWFSYILFLIFLGGLMVLFIYITSLASNEKFTYEAPQKNFITLSMAMILMILIFNNYDQIFMLIEPPMKSLYKEMYYLNTMLLTLMTMVYLLLTLIVAIKMVSKYKGPLRSMVD